jgi:AmmeMemoRadiSam system protein A
MRSFGFADRQDSAAAPARALVQREAEFSAEERRYVLAIARQAIERGLRGEYPEIEARSNHLAEPRGVFTTLKVAGKLRGCVGQPFAVEPLVQAVAATAIGAAARDPRFPPVASTELQNIRISVSVLSPIVPIAIEEIEIGRHGLLISLGAQRGLLLPEVPMNMGWDLRTFLEQTCQKSGLAFDAWCKGATVEAFTTESFSEDD